MKRGQFFGKATPTAASIPAKAMETSTLAPFACPRDFRKDCAAQFRLAPFVAGSTVTVIQTAWLSFALAQFAQSGC